MTIQTVERAPVPTWYLLLVRELMEAGNQLADLIEDPPTNQAEAEDQQHAWMLAVRRWEAALVAAGQGVI
jgi:hypothetical protein